MNYFLRRRGEDFSLAELRRRREARRIGKPLDAVLREGYRVTPSQLPPAVRAASPNSGIIVAIIVVGILIFVAMMVWFARIGFLFFRRESIPEIEFHPPIPACCPFST